MNYICFEEDALILFNAQKMNTLLCFKYSPFSISEIDSSKMRSPDINFNALLGIKMLDNIPFLMVAQQAEPCCNIGTSTIFQIKKIDWIPIVKKQQVQSVLDKTQQKIKDMAKLFDEGFHYYSDVYRLNTTFYFNIMNQETAEQRKFYSQFIFNQSIFGLNQQQNITSWCKPIIQGYIEQFSARLTPYQNITYTIISRRSNKKQGTRYFARGIDDKGNVANFTETQQIISFGKFMISHLQVRGSVPAFFEQLGISGLSGELNITRNQATTQKAFQTHFAKLNSVYDKIFCVNLLSIKKSEQQKLTVFYQNLVNNYAPQYVRYQYFDFHQECKNNQFDNSDKLIEKIKKIIKSFSVTVFDTKLKKLISKQTGVIRTNCLDCLDRTNYMQSRIALYEFKKVVQNFSDTDTRDEINRYELFANRQQESSQILRKFNSAWADNGDKISLHYTGIGSTHTDITKLGKRTLKGTVNHKVRSLMRFFVQFSDHKKNQAIQTIVTNPLMRSSSNQFNKPEVQFVNIVLMSYQMDREQTEDQRKNKANFTQDYVEIKRPVAVVVYAYQQRKSSILGWLKRGKPRQSIQKFVEEQTIKIRKLGYEVIKKVINQNDCMIILGNQIAIQNVTEIKNENIQEHNQTLTICKLNIYHSSMVFTGVNCENFKGFSQILQKSHEQAFQQDKLGQAKSSSILSHNYRTVMGNTTSGNSKSREQIEDIKKQLQYLRAKNDTKGQMRLITEILDNDELSNAINKDYQYLKNYMEGPAYFAPQGNRIIFWNKENLITKVLDYNSNEFVKCTYGHFCYQLH